MGLGNCSIKVRMTVSIQKISENKMNTNQIHALIERFFRNRLKEMYCFIDELQRAGAMILIVI